MIVNLRIDGDPTAVAIVTEALRTLLSDTAKLGVPRASSYGKYAGTALARGTVGATTVAERAATVAALIEQTDNHIGGQHGDHRNHRVV